MTYTSTPSQPGAVEFGHPPLHQVEKLTEEKQQLTEDFVRYCEKCGYTVRSQVMYSTFINTDRKWRADFVLYDKSGYAMIVVEIQGGGYNYGRHHRPAGYADDLRKSNRTQYIGMMWLAYTWEMMKDLEYTEDIE